MYYYVMFMCWLKFATCADTGKGNSVMLVNDQVIVVNESDSIFKGNYKYVDGELAKFTCIRDNNTFHMQNITYQEKEYGHSFVGVNEHVMVLYTKLKKENSPEYIDCIIVNVKPPKRYVTIRISLAPETADYPKFKVNRLLLSPLRPLRTDSDLTYSYEYYVGEKLNITIDIGNRRLVSIGCNSSDTIIREKFKYITKTNLKVISINTEEFVVNVTSFKCSLKFYYSTQFYIELKLVPNQHSESNPQIIGVSLSRLISNYINSQSIHEKIFYPYYNNETLALNCSMNGTVKWVFNDSEVINTPITTPGLYNTDTGIFVDAQKFQLKESVNSSVLNCTHYELKSKKKNQNTQIVLVRSEDYKEDAVSVTTTPGIVSDATTNVIDINNDSPRYVDANTPNSDSSLSNKHNGDTENEGKLDPLMFYIIIGAVVGVILLAIIVIILVVCKMKKEVHQKVESDINYENLPEHNGGSMPIPSQWNNDYANSTEALYNNVNNEPTYAKAIPKSMRNKLNITYAVPHTSNVSNAYSTPYNGKSESPYAEIIPQSQRNQEHKCRPNPDNANYAQVIPKSQRNNVNLNKVLPTANDNSAIDIRSRADSDKNKYENVFDKERYVNAKSSDYVEPAYASIDSLK